MNCWPLQKIHHNHYLNFVYLIFTLTNLQIKQPRSTHLFCLQLSHRTYFQLVRQINGTYRQNFTIKDSRHVLEIFRDFHFLGQNKLNFTMDITSLCTVIPNDEGLWALEHFYDQRTVREPSSETLLRLAEP